MTGEMFISTNIYMSNAESMLIRCAYMYINHALITSCMTMAKLSVNVWLPRLNAKYAINDNILFILLLAK